MPGSGWQRAGNARPYTPTQGPAGSLVALRKRDCLVCDAGEDVFASVNEVIWDGERRRTRSYRAAGVLAMAASGITTAVATIARHADHVERSWHIVDALHPQVGREAPVQAVDFRGVTSRFIAIGHDALTSIAASLEAGLMEDADLIKVAALGLQAAKMRQLAEQADKRPQIDLEALFALAGGYMRPDDVSEYEGILKDVTPRLVETMRDEMHAEREQLKALQAGTP